ncbi:MAG: hypothetical protein K2P81_03185 [Bacteriovoracaceae bacterium]|nr:hypothetical protein [Bacteriovoracaceae bacterium]
MWILLLALSAFNAQAFECSEPQWVTPAALKNGRFIGNLKASCQIKKSGGSIRSVSTHFQKQATVGVLTVHSGPVNDFSLGLPGVVYDITAKDPNGSIRSKIKMASDERDRFVYDSKSSEINLSGLAGYLRVLNLAIEVKRLNENAFSVTLINGTEVAKPGLAPGGIFLNMAAKKAIEEFSTQLPKLAKEVEASL